MAQVSPARAGMDPGEAVHRHPRRRFPRTRGDGPLSVSLGRHDRWFPPHARGWTLWPWLLTWLVVVSPARAGMASTIGGPIRSFPPHARGWTLRKMGQSGMFDKFPPHARGWTLAPSRTPGCSMVSPARAGMDPWRPHDMRNPRCFPRTRGDGPPPRILSPTMTSFPPHARGWTGGWWYDTGEFVVSPARAGMDR